VFAELERRRATLVTVDAPELPGLFPRLDVVTNPDLFYARFHGRNARGWRSGHMQKQFDYDYTDEELRAWADGPLPRMADRAAEGVIFFNNHVRAQAPIYVPASVSRRLHNSPISALRFTPRSLRRTGSTPRSTGSRLASGHRNACTAPNDALGCAS
jgi:uncharacterized protein YecE (DUF72 family)